MQDIKKITLAALFLSTAFAAKANFIWPSLFIMEGYYASYTIVLALIIEIVAAHWFLKTDWKKSIITMVVTNLISAILGLVLIPLSGIIVEILTIPLNVGTFHISHVILDYICMVLINACVEGLALKWIFKYPFKPNFWWLFVANLISVLINILFLWITLS